MILSRLPLNPQSREVMRCLGDVYALHQRVMAGFRDQPIPRAEQGVLHRVEIDRRGSILYIQSHRLPDWSTLPAGFLAGSEDHRSLAPVVEALRPELVLAFRLRAHAAKRSHAMGTGQHNNPRVPLRSEPERLAWLVRKGLQHGFTLAADPRITHEPVVSGTCRDHRMIFAGTLYEGLLRITEIARFRDALVRGIGPSKAFGFGLLSVAKAN